MGSISNYSLFLTSSELVLNEEVSDFYTETCEILRIKTNNKILSYLKMLDITTSTMISKYRFEKIKLYLETLMTKYVVIWKTFAYCAFVDNCRIFTDKTKYDIFIGKLKESQISVEEIEKNCDDKRQPVFNVFTFEIQGEI